MTYICRNFCDRSNNPKVYRATMEDEARNWCKFTSKDFYGIFCFSKEGAEPLEFWSGGRKYKTVARAQIAGSS